jgi:hypothetical protein
MPDALSRRPLSSEAWVRSQASLCEICGGKSGIGTGFLPSTAVFTCQYSTSAPYSIFMCMLLVPEEQVDVVWEPPKCLSEIGGCWIEKYFHFCSVFKALSRNIAPN